MGMLDYYNRAVLEEIEKMNKVYKPRPHCYLLCLHLQSLFSTGRIWYDMNHCLFWYQGGLYDHTGEVPRENIDMAHYCPIDEYGIEEILPLQKAMLENNGSYEV